MAQNTLLTYSSSLGSGSEAAAAPDRASQPQGARRMPLPCCPPLASIALAFATAGCSSPGGNAISLSELTGVWMEASVLRQEDASPLIVVHPDGRFELRQTMATMYGDLSLLRNPGDRMQVAFDPDRTLEVVRSEFCRTRSTIVYRIHDPHAAPFPEDTVFVIEGVLSGDGQAAFRCAPIASTAAPVTSIPSVSYKRISTEVGRHIAPMTPDDLEDARDYSREVRVHQGAAADGTKFFLTVPLEREGPLPLVVYLPTLDYANKADARAQDLARPAVRLGFAVLTVDVDMFDYRSGKARSRIEQDRQAVLAAVDAARAMQSVGAVYLYATYEGGYLAHAIWREDNRLFSGFMAVDAGYAGEHENVGQLVNRELPLYLWALGGPPEELYRVGTWYRQGGFTHVDVRDITPAANDDVKATELERFRTLLGRRARAHSGPAPLPKASPVRLGWWYGV